MSTVTSCKGLVGREECNRDIEFGPEQVINLMRTNVGLRKARASNDRIEVYRSTPMLPEHCPSLAYGLAETVHMLRR